jgi:hypothetical protein
MPDGVCPKCGWRAPAGLLKCPFCKTYIRKPGSGSSGEERPVPKKPPPSESSGVVIAIPPIDPTLPPPDPNVMKKVQREIARELFDDSDKWEVLAKDPPSDPDESTETQDEG